MHMDIFIFLFIFSLRVCVCVIVQAPGDRNDQVIIVGGFGASKLYFKCDYFNCNNTLFWPFHLEFEQIINYVLAELDRCIYSVNHGENILPVRAFAKNDENYSVERLRYIDTDKSYIPMFDKYIDKLKVNGYVSEESMFAIEYDFRVPSEDYIKTQLENIFKKSKKKKMIVTHSYGGIMTLLALSKMNNELVRDNVKSVVLISCPLGGATESLFAYLTGQFHNKFDLNFILSILLKHTLRLCTTMYLLMSNIKSPNYSKTLLTKFGKNYTMHNLEWIIGSRRYNEYKKYQKKMQELFTYLTKFLESSGKNKSAPFTLYCVYGITTTPHTVLSYNYDKGTVDVTTGDGSVEEGSLELCTKYTKTENRKKITLDDKIDQHVFILRYEEVVLFLANLLN